MSPLLDIQRRFRELGRIRLGERGAGGRPVKLSEFRLTSSSRELLDACAAAYGGQVVVWEGAPTEGRQWELKTGTDRLDVVVPPGEPISQFWELWSGGGCQRRCNGFTNLLTDGPCECPTDLNERAELSKTGKACKATTRFSVILPRIPDVGVWRLETHGMNAAVELPGTIAILEAAISQGRMIPAQLRIEQRTAKKDGQTRHFIVPVLELPTVTTAQLMRGEGTVGIGAGQPLEIEAPAPAALPAAGASQSNGETASASSPPQPPLPGETPPAASDEFTDADVVLAGVEFSRTFAIQAKEAGAETDEQRHAIVRYATGGRVESSKKVLKTEVDACFKALSALRRGRLELITDDDGFAAVTEKEAAAS